MLQEAKTLFHDTAIKFTVEGKRHLGASLGSNSFRVQYVSEKVNTWCKEVEKLSEFAKTQPHAAFSAFIHGEQHKFTYFMRTIPGMEEHLTPLDKVINDNFFTCTIWIQNIFSRARSVLAANTSRRTGYPKICRGSLPRVFHFTHHNCTSCCHNDNAR